MEDVYRNQKTSEIIAKKNKDCANSPYFFLPKGKLPKGTFMRDIK
jgi:hypothetical protein